ncbi:WD40 repeat [Streptomyces sp. Ncost-T6T-2b]|nr:WD40 repeat [Streptomyces sp. Ncost-T6T-2b]
MFRKLRDRQQPLPRRQVGDRSGQLVIAPNPAFPPPAPAPRAPTPEAYEPEPGRCPYPGLDPYGVDDAHVFFGRKRMTDRVLASARASDDTPGPLILVGASGSGKTSLLNAGLIPRLRDNGLPGSARWPCLRLTPGSNPFQSLARQLDTSAAALVDALRDDPGRATDFLDHVLKNEAGQRLILLVDQLEELFTLCEDPAEQTAFLQAVTAMALPHTDDGPPRALVVLALRADFYAQAAAHPEALAVLDKAQLLVEPMTTEELGDAIEKPAAVGGLALDDKLADLILHELGASADERSPVGALPLLSHVLRATWQEDGGTRLTVSGYLATGGIRAAIAQTAERVYTDMLDQDGRLALRTLLLRLVRVGDDTADTAQPVKRPALLSGLPKPDSAQRAINALVKARLITLDQDTARISHESLLRAWPRLRDWIDADRAWLSDRRRLADDAASWVQAGRDSSLLYRGNRLAAVRERAARASGAAVLEPDLAEFLDASSRQERRRTRRLRTTLTIFVTLTVLAFAGLGGAIVFQRQAEQAHERDLARFLAAEAEELRTSQPGLAKQLSLLAHEIDREAGRGAVLNSQRTPGVINGDEPAHDIGYSANGRVLAISTGGSITLLAGGRTGRIGGALAGPLTLNGEGTLLAAATYDHGQSPSATIRLWDIADPGRPRQIAALPVKPTIAAVALGADDRTLFAGASTGEILRWGLDGRAAPSALPSLRAHPARVDSLAVSPRHDLLASMSVDGRIQLWNVADATRPEPVSRLRGQAYKDNSSDHLRPLHRVAFAASGRLLAAPVGDGSKSKLALWNLDDPRTPRRLGQARENPTNPTNSCNDDLTSVAFSPTNPHIAGTCGIKWSVWAYDPSPSPGSIVSGASSSGQDARSGMVLFDPNNARRLLQATTTGIHVWDLSNAAQPGARAYLPMAPGTGSQLDYTQAGKRRLIAYQGPGGNYLWNVSDLNDPDLLTLNLAPDMFTANGIALSPDGGTLATVERFKKNKNDKDEYVGIRLRKTAIPDGPPLATIEEELENGVQSLLFSPTAPILVVSDFNGIVAANRGKPTIRIFDISDPRHPRQISRIATQSFKLAFSPDGRTLIISESPAKQAKTPRPGSGPRLHGWDLTDPAHPAKLWTRQLPASTHTPNLALRPDGALLAVSEGNGNLLLWRVERQRLIGRPVSVSVSANGIDNLAFSPDGTHLALTATLASSEQRPEIWDLSDPGSPARLSYLPGNGSAGLYALKYSPDGETLAVVRASAGVDLWDTDPERIVKNLCNAVGDPITREQWNRYLPDRPYRPPCR